jgi:20S proteasome alpha/beta subunit
MTVVVGQLVEGAGAVLACDSRITCGYSILTDACDKFLVCGSAVVLVSGDDGGLMAELAHTRHFDTVRAAALAYTEGKQLTWELLIYDRRVGGLFVLNSDGATVPLGSYAALGAGGDIALGVLGSAPVPKDLVSATRLVKRAARVAVKHNSGCGGKIRVLTIRGKRDRVEVA